MLSRFEQSSVLRPIRRAIVFVLFLLFNLSAYAQESSEEQQELLFDIWEYRVEGNTILSTKEIEIAVYGFLGPDKSLSIVEQARTKLEEQYRSKGYGTVLVDIPEQDVDKGIVRLAVNEAKISRVKVTGSRYFSNRRIKELLPSVQEGEIPNIKDVQEDLALLNPRSNDRTITPLIRPGKAPGTVEMELKVKDELPFHYSIELDDRNTVDTTDLRLTGTISFDNLWQREHSLAINYQTSPKDTGEVEVWSANYLYRPERSDNLFLFYAVDSDSEISSIGGLSVIGNGQIYGARGIFPLNNSAKLFHNLNAGFDYKDFEDDIQIGGVVASGVSTPVDYGLFSFTYGGTYLTESASPVRFNAGANFGLRGFFNTENEFNGRRFGANPNFLFIKADIERDFALGSHYVLATRLAGQFTGAPLISNEQFALGGLDSVRGYLEADSLVDRGITGSVEVQSPALFVDHFEWLDDLQAFTFFDWATGDLREALPEQTDSFDLAGIGAGVNFTLFKNIDGSISWARPLRGSASTEANDDRMHFRVGYSY